MTSPAGRLKAAASRTVGVMTAVAAVASLPAVIAHEATHAAVSLPWARRVGIVIEPRSADAAVGVDWRENTPVWAIVIAKYAPLVIGLVMAVVALAYIGLYRAIPTDQWGWLYGATLGYWWYIYAWPSPDDRQTITTNVSE